ncbi:MAG: 2,3-bisphosphoglycerate-dependent phosphoglycerate mutase [Gaiellaceae bacterium]|nr:2,3-bisphosphoglycerate-dependent phosphoglycerate mutase [Gaiellaceae bacterium]
MRRVILARHGESEFSVVGRTNGDPRIPCALTEVGREQARELARALAGDLIDLCVTSEFQRAQETADLALEGREVPRLVLSGLNDIRFGEFEGRALTDYRAWAHTHGPEEPAPGGGDSRAQTVARYVAAYGELLERPEAMALVVAHGLPVRYVLDALESRNPAAAVAQVPYAQPFDLSADELRRAVARLAAWAERPVWPS